MTESEITILIWSGISGESRDSSISIVVVVGEFLEKDLPFLCRGDAGLSVGFGGRRVMRSLFRTKAAKSFLR
jgi:hypothetical protein